MSPNGLRDGSAGELPGVREALPPSRSLARADVGGLGSGFASAPYLVGDGCAPQGMQGTTSLGRVMIEATGLAPTAGGLTGPGNAPAFLLTGPNAALASITGIQATGNTVFTVQEPIPGAGVPGPISLSGTGIGGVADPGASFQQVAQNAFETGTAFPSYGKAGVAQYDQPTSGSLPSTSPGQQDAFLFYNYMVDSSVVFPGYGVGFIKLTENMSPLPRDRVYMNYSYFHNANFGDMRADVNRFTPGYEKTFFDGWTSIEIRTPFAGTLDSTQDVTFPGGGSEPQMSQYRNVEFGNMSVIFKTLLWEQRTWAITGGVQVMVPTANNTSIMGPSVNAIGNIQQVFVANESVHVMPFVGSIWAPNNRFFNQALLQIDTDVNGNPAYVNNLQDPTLRDRNLSYAGRAYYPNFMYLSFGTGYWLYRNNNANFTGFSPIMEVHLNQAFNAFDPICYQNWQLGQSAGVVSITNALIGCNFEWNTRATLTFAYVTPLGGGVDRFFDGEFRALYNWRFGPQNRLTRAQF